MERNKDLELLMWLVDKQINKIKNIDERIAARTMWVMAQSEFLEIRLDKILLKKRK